MRDNLFKVEDDGGEKVTIRNVPVFQKHTDRDYNCDEEWLDRCVADFNAQKAEAARIGGSRYAMLPPITIGHTPEDADAPEPPSIGFVDNLRRVGGVLYCDFVDVPREDWLEMKKNRYPYRSAEIIPKRHRLTNVSLLGGRYPHFPLPVMRFSAMGSDGQPEEIVRYTIRGNIMATRKGSDQEQVDRHNFGPGGNGAPQAGMGGMGGMGGGAPQAPQLSPQVIQQIAQQVAKLLAEGQANAPGGPMAHAGAYKDQTTGRIYYRESDERWFYLEDGKACYAEDDGGKPKVKAGMGSDEQDLSETERTPKQSKEATGVDKNSNLPAEVKKYMADMDQRFNDLQAENKELRTKLGEVLRNRDADQQAAKRSMLTSKFKEIAALGYAIGDKDMIERHVNRCMSLSNEEAVKYIEDVKGMAPKVRSAVERHGTSDVIRRPGSEDDNERYYLEHKDDLDRIGVDKTVLELGDLLGGGEE